MGPCRRRGGGRAGARRGTTQRSGPRAACRELTWDGTSQGQCPSPPRRGHTLLDDAPEQTPARCRLWVLGVLHLYTCPRSPQSCEIALSGDLTQRLARVARSATGPAHLTWRPPDSLKAQLIPPCQTFTLIPISVRSTTDQPVAHAGRLGVVLDSLPSPPTRFHPSPEPTGLFSLSTSTTPI